MNRREAIAALVAMPQITRILAAPVKATDVIVVESDVLLTTEAMERIRETLKPVWPNNKVVVCDRHTRIKVVSP